MSDSAPETSSPVREPVVYECLGAAEAAFVEALVNVMCPADELTPNGVDCGLAIFIDRQLARELGKGARRYSQGPWRQGIPHLGNQLPMTPEQFFKAGIVETNAESVRRFGRTFAELDATDADALLDEIADGKVTNARVPLKVWFDEVAYPLFTQACFSDPMYGGNRDKVFWRMIGYPGLPARYREQIVTLRGKKLDLEPKSIADFG